MNKIFKCLSEHQKLIIASFIISIIYSIIIFILHYEHEKLPLILIVFAYIFICFWGIFITLLLLFFLIACIFIITQCICIEYCREDSKNETIMENNNEINENNNV